MFEFLIASGVLVCSMVGISKLNNPKDVKVIRKKIISFFHDFKKNKLRFKNNDENVSYDIQKTLQNNHVSFYIFDNDSHKKKVSVFVHEHYTLEFVYDFHSKACSNIVDGLHVLSDDFKYVFVLHVQEMMEQLYPKKENDRREQIKDSEILSLMDYIETNKDALDVYKQHEYEKVVKRHNRTSLESLKNELNEIKENIERYREQEFLKQLEKIKKER